MQGRLKAAKRTPNLKDIIKVTNTLTKIKLVNFGGATMESNSY